MTVTLYNVPEDFRHISKTLGTGTAYGGATESPRGALDHVVPSILINAKITGAYNYAYIDTYGAYYWVKEISNERENLSRVDMVRDPLTTFAAGVRACPCIGGRSADLSKTTAFIRDDSLKTNAYTMQQQIAPATTNIFSYNGNLVLLTSG